MQPGVRHETCDEGASGKVNWNKSAICAA